VSAMGFGGGDILGKVIAIPTGPRIQSIESSNGLADQPTALNTGRGLDSPRVRAHLLRNVEDMLPVTYLGFPRLHFTGIFQADPSTINNVPSHFDTDRFAARFQHRQTANALNGGWNPRGSGSWRLRNCRVTSVILADGAFASFPEADPVVGGTLSDADDRVSAKIADLDPQQQLVSQIWGLRLRLAESTGRNAFAGDFEPAPLSDIWLRYPHVRSDAAFGATFQSVIKNITWLEGPSSEFLRQLRDASDERLSIKFNVDGFNDDFTSPWFSWGRIVGSIGPYSADEPTHFVAARMLWPPPGSSSPLNAAPCRIDSATNMLFVDFGNSLPTAAGGGPLQDVGTLWVVALPPMSPPVVLAVLNPAGGDFYEQQAGILSVLLSHAQTALAARSRIGILDSTRTTLLLAENPSATYVRADDIVFRMSPQPPDAVARSTLFATRYGVPAAELTIAVSHFDLMGQMPRRPGEQIPVGIPASALSVPESITTDAAGRAELVLTASSPGNPRGFIDGQVYGVSYALADEPFDIPGTPLSIRVWDDYREPEHPAWVTDILPIFQQYTNLYPSMRDALDLSDYHTVVRHREVLRRVLELPVEDANFMPVTRDLSPAKRAMISRWLSESEPLFTRSDISSLRSLLQLAIAVEHATIPPYLCALFSIRPGSNPEVAMRIRGVVMEEMFHVALACNLLNAVGGSPALDRPGFVPRYPDHLPGGFVPDLAVSLRRCSLEQMRVFSVIEQAEGASDSDGMADVDVRGVNLDPRGMIAGGRHSRRLKEAVEHLERSYTRIVGEPRTVGGLFRRIARAIVELERSGAHVFSGDPSHQLTPAMWSGAPGRLYRVTDKSSALLAIHEIVRQSGGTPLDDPSEDRHDLSHYFRFQEIVEGRQVIRNAAGEWVFEGAPVPFDPDGVFPMKDDPDTSALDPSSPAAMASALFDQTYADLLRSLHVATNGSPWRLNDAIGLMSSLKVQAYTLMTTPIGFESPLTVGPSFQFG
jgi:hypothetical protein